MPQPSPPAENPDLLAAVIAAPADDVPRLVYADWLEENGQGERAEFIRVQCRLAGVFADDPEYIPLKDRETELAAWLNTFAPLSGPRLPAGFAGGGEHFGYANPTTVERGFPSVLYAVGHNTAYHTAYEPPMAWLDQLFRTTTLRDLTVFTGHAGLVARLLSHPATGTLAALALQGDVLPGVLPALAASPAAASVTRLRVSGDLTVEQCVELAAMSFPRLRSLSVVTAAAGEGGMAALRRAEWFANLTSLTVDQGSDYDLHALAAGKPLPKLRALRLIQGQAAVGLTELARSKAVPNLVSLDVEESPLTASAVAALADAKWKLAELLLRGCDLRASGAGHILSAKWLGSLKVLDVSFNELSFGAVSLAGCERFRSLRHLDLSHTASGWGILSAVAGNKALRRLTRLDLSPDPDDARGVAVKVVAGFLADLNMPQLRHLGMSTWPVGAAGAKAIAENPAFANLTSLELDNCKLGNAGAAALSAAPQLQNLVRLRLGGNGITAADAFAKATTFPRCGELWLAGNKFPPAVKRKLQRRPGVMA